MVHPTPAKEPVGDHVVSEQIDDGNQNPYKQNP
jgi:hypothetical protein